MMRCGWRQLDVHDRDSLIPGTANTHTHAARQSANWTNDTIYESGIFVAGILLFRIPLVCHSAGTRRGAYDQIVIAKQFSISTNLSIYLWHLVR